MKRLILVLVLTGCGTANTPAPFEDVTGLAPTWQTGAAGAGDLVTFQDQDQPVDGGVGTPSPPTFAGAAAPPFPPMPEEDGSLLSEPSDAGMAGLGSFPDAGPDAEQALEDAGSPAEPDAGGPGCFLVVCRDSGAGRRDAGPPADSGADTGACAQDPVLWDCRGVTCDGTETIDDSDEQPWVLAHPMWDELHDGPLAERCTWPKCVGGEANQVVTKPDGYYVDVGTCYTCAAGVAAAQSCP